MPTYLSPGVYLEEVPPAARPIAGVSTSTAGFIGIVRDSIAYPERILLKEKGVTDKKEFDLNYPVDTDKATFRATVDRKIVEDVLLDNDKGAKKSKVTFAKAPDKDALIEVNYVWETDTFTPSVAVGEPKLVTNFTEFTKSFGSFSMDRDQRLLAHAVYGFFDNGGSRCYVARVTKKDDVEAALKSFATIDEIAMVAIPGITDEGQQEAVIKHCEKLEDRVAVLDGVEKPDPLDKEHIQNVRDSDKGYGAIYFPWIKVKDPIEGVRHLDGNGNAFVPPSGHVAGIYAQVDATRGVHKAPANVAIRGALDVKYRLTREQQDGLNPGGVNLLRVFGSKNVKVWGARTMGGDANGEFKYISTRRYFNFLRESIEESTQWVVFEPNSRALWQRIIRSVSDFLLGQWREGALFGDTPKQAFFVKCDEETNPPDVRERGQVITLVGVAIVKPAEFVVFRLEQMTGG